MAEITLRQLQYFVAVVDRGSVTAAAQAEHISQAAASMAIAQLEKALGADLLLRTRSKRVVPTREGYLFATHARRLLDGADEAVEAVAASVGQISGTLRVGCSYTLSPRLIPELVSSFVEHHPQVEIDFREGPPGEVQEDVRTGRLDAGLLYQQQADPDLHHHVLTEVRLHAVLPASHRLAARRTVKIAEIAEEPAIFLSIPPTVERLIAQVRAAGSEPRIRYTSDNIQTILSLVARGFGYSLLNSPPATGHTFDGRRVVFVPVRDEATHNAIVAVTAGQHNPPRRVQAAIAALRGA